MNPVVSILIFSGAFVLLMAAAVWLRHKGVAGEWTRKLMHVGMGLATLTFPWLFHEAWPVLVLTGGFVVVMLSLRLIPRLSGVVCGVARVSWGEIYFPIAVGGLFLLTQGRVVEYVIPILVLTLADAAAALAGVRLGRHKYSAGEGTKSWEGTTVFCVIAFLCTLLPLLAGTGMDWPRAVLIALCVSFIGGIVEASAWQGIDNLLLPFSTLLMLRIYPELPLGQLWLRLGLLGVLVVIFLVIRRRMLMCEGTMLGALLAIYLCWVFGDPRWVVAPLLMVLVHRLPARWTPSELELKPVGHHALLALILPALAWVFAWRLGAPRPCFAAFHVTVAAHLAMTILALWRSDLRGGWRLIVPAVLAALVVIGLPWWLLDEGRNWMTALRGGGAVAAAALAWHFILKRIGDGPALEHWTWRGSLAALASFAV
jgi:phytol kinase